MNGALSKPVNVKTLAASIRCFGVRARARARSPLQSFLRILLSRRCLSEHQALLAALTPPPPFLSPEYTLDSHMQSRCAICMSKTCRYRKSIELVRRWRTLRTYKRRTRTGYFPKPLQLTSRRWRVAQWPAWPLLDRRVPPLPGKGLKRTGLINSLDLARKESKSCRVRVRVV